MYSYCDYVDILKNLFMKFGCVKKHQNIQNKKIIIDSKIIIENYL